MNLNVCAMQQSTPSNQKLLLFSSNNEKWTQHFNVLPTEILHDFLMTASYSFHHQSCSLAIKKDLEKSTPKVYNQDRKLNYVCTHCDYFTRFSYYNYYISFFCELYSVTPFMCNKKTYTYRNSLVPGSITCSMTDGV